MLPYAHDTTADFDQEQHYSYSPTDEYNRYRFDVDEYKGEAEHTFEDWQDERLFGMDHYNEADDPNKKHHSTE